MKPTELGRPTAIKAAPVNNPTNDYMTYRRLLAKLAGLEADSHAQQAEIADKDAIIARLLSALARSVGYAEGVGHPDPYVAKELAAIIAIVHAEPAPHSDETASADISGPD